MTETKNVHETMAFVQLEVGKISNPEFRNHYAASGVRFAEPAMPAKSCNECTHNWKNIFTL